MNKIKVLICGGHLSPALAMIEKIKEEKNIEVIYIGRKKALEGDKAQSLEYKTITKLDIPFYNLIAARLQRSFTLYTIPSLCKLPLGFIQSLILLFIIRPKIVVSFGGYVALPVCINAKILSIPIITHEQTTVLGLANRVIAKISKALCLSYDNTSNIPKGVTTVYTGNPIRSSIIPKGNKNIVFGDSKLPIIYVTGGNLGSRPINKVIGQMILELADKYRVYHQCGGAENGKDFQELLQLKNNLPEKIKDNYLIVEHVDPERVGEILQNTSLLIGRAGANTVNEILYFEVPSILIPLPWAGQNEQMKNAEMVQKSGLGKIIFQKNLDSHILLRTISEMMEKMIRPQKSQGNVTKISSTTAADKILQLIKKIV